MSKMAIKPVSRKSDLVTQELEKEILTYDLITDKAFSLNETSALIWSLCNGKNSVSEIAAELRQKLNSPVDEDFVWLALEQLKKNNLLKNGEEISIEFGDLPRREAIRKVGFATLAALPVIVAVSAPLAVRAVSTTCSTAAPGGTQCRCDCSVARGSTCMSGLAADPCNPGCTCTRTAISCYSGADPGLVNTALGSCS